MIEDTRITLNEIAKRIENIENSLIKLLDVFETLTSAKALTEEITEIKRDVLKLAEERNIFNKK